MASRLGRFARILSIQQRTHTIRPLEESQNDELSSKRCIKKTIAPSIQVTESPNSFGLFTYIPEEKKWNMQTRSISRRHGCAPREQALWWSHVANVTFDFGTDPQSEIRIAFDQADGARSYIGLDCAEIPFGLPTMNLGFFDGGTAGA
jgi:hypothetical protein